MYSDRLDHSDPGVVAIVSVLSDREWDEFTDNILVTVQDPNQLALHQVRNGCAVIHLRAGELVLFCLLPFVRYSIRHSSSDWGLPPLIN